MRNPRTPIVAFLLVLIVVSLSLNTIAQENSHEVTEIPEVFQLNHTSTFDKEGIKEWVEKHNWEEAYHLALNSYRRSVLRSIKYLGGTRIVLKAEDTGDLSEEEKTRIMERIIAILKARLNRFGFTEVSIKPLEGSKIVAELPATVDPGVARKLIGRTGLLEFKLVLEVGSPGSSLSPNKSNQEVIYGRKLEEGKRRPYLVPEEAFMTGRVLKDAEVNSSKNSPIHIALQFNQEGEKDFADVITRLEPDKDRIAIVVYDVVQSAPVISQGIWNQAKNTNSIGRAIIPGDFTSKEAKILSVILQSGPLPVEVNPINMSKIQKNTRGMAFGEETIRANALLYTPMFSWIKQNYKGELRFWSQEKIEEEYQEQFISPDVGAHFEIQIKTKNKSGLLEENLRFVLEDKKENRWESQTEEFGGIEKKQTTDSTTYERNVDVWFNFSKDRKPGWLELTLYIIRMDKLGRDEVSWTFWGNLY